ncbi:MAG: hypothetical protein ACI9WU_001321, partial [Myxococcota bacterium]
FYLVDTRPLPLPVDVSAVRSDGEVRVEAQVTAWASVARADHTRLATFLGTLVGDASGLSGKELYDLLRPEVERDAQRLAVRHLGQNPPAWAAAEQDLTQSLQATVGDRHGLNIRVTVAPVASMLSLSLRLGAALGDTGRTCVACDAGLPGTRQFCTTCGSEQPRPFASAHGSLLTADDQPIELDVLLQARGEPHARAEAAAGEALASAAAAALRSVTFGDLAGEGLAALGATLEQAAQQALEALALEVVAVVVLDVRSATGQWVRGARADLERARREAMVGREWIQADAERLDVKALALEVALRRQQVERDHRLAHDLALANDRAQRGALADQDARLDVADAARAEQRGQDIGDLTRERARYEAAEGHSDRRVDLDRAAQTAGVEREADRAAVRHRADMERDQAALMSEKRRLSANDRAYEGRSQNTVAGEAADADQIRQLEKLRRMATLDRELAEQEHAHRIAEREQLAGMDADQMLAAQAVELAGEPGGAGVAEALAATQAARAAITRETAHGSEMKEVMQGALEMAKDLATEAMRAGAAGRTEATASYKDSAAEAGKGARAAMESMSRVAATAAGGAHSCRSCGASLQPPFAFCGVCGAEQS